MGGDWSVMSLKEILKTNLCDSTGDAYYQVPLTEVEMPEKELPLDPYLLGALLGDGSFRGVGVKLAGRVDDKYILDRCASGLPKDTMLGKYNAGEKSYQQALESESGNVSGVRLAIRELGLDNLKGHQKFIPEEYLFASWDQRLALLQGLMDTNGSIDDRNRVIYSTKSSALARDMDNLVKSLGGLTSVTSDNKDGKRLCFTMDVKFNTLNPFGLPRKAYKCTPRTQQQVRKNIVKIEKLPEKVEQQCISLDGDHLYITDGYTTTHNTILSLAMAETNESDLVIIICPLATTQEVWESTIQQIFKKKQKYWLSKSKTRIDFKARFHIVHYETLKNYSSDMEKSSRKWEGKKITVVIDESHNLNEATSIRTQEYVKLVDMLNPNMVLPMSGTSVKAVSMELLPSFRAIDPSFTDSVGVKFKKMYSGNNTGAVRLLRQRVTDMTYVVKKNEIGVVPPEKISVEIEVPNGEIYTLESIKTKLRAYMKDRTEFYKATAGDDRKAFYTILKLARENAKAASDNDYLVMLNKYNEVVDEIINTTNYATVLEEIKHANKFEREHMADYLDDDTHRLFKAIKTQVKYPELKIVGEAIGNVLTRLRAEAHAEMVLHADLGSMINNSLSKTLIFFTSKMVGDTINDKLVSEGYNPISVYGDSAKDLNANVQKFHNDKDINPMVASYKTLGTGVELKVASTTIITELPYRDYILQQALARTARIGQEHPTTAIYLILYTGGEPNISTRSREIIQWASESVKEITGIEVSSALADDRAPNITQESISTETIFNL